MQRLRIGWDRQEEVGLLLLERPKNGRWVSKRIRLDENALQIQLADQLHKHRPLMVACGGIAGLAARQAQSGRIQLALGNERGIRWRLPQLQAECHGGQDAVVANGESLQIPLALAAALGVGLLRKRIVLEEKQ